MKNRLHILAILILFPLAVFSQWQTQSITFQDSLREIQSIWAVDESVVWVSAEYDGPADSTIQEYAMSTNGGLTWTSGLIPGAAGYISTMIFALNADTAYITFYHDTQDGGRIMRTTDGGQNWVHQSSASFPASEEAFPNIVYFWDAQDGFAMGDPTLGYFELYTTNNGGDLWTRVDSVNIPATLPGEYGYAAEFSVIGNTVYFGTSEGRVFKSTDRGFHWTAINTPLLNTGKCRITEFRDSLHGIVADRSNNLADMYETNDGGQSWQQIIPSGTAYGRYMEYIPGTDSTYISSSDGGSNSGVSISYDDGHNWMSAAIAGIDDYGVMSFPNPYAGWCANGQQGGSIVDILKYVGNTVGADIGFKMEVAVWPNPVNDHVNIRIPDKQIERVSLVDISGKCLISKTPVENELTRINTASLTAGTYLLRIEVENRILHKKIIVIQ